MSHSLVDYYLFSKRDNYQDQIGGISSSLV